MKHLSPSDYGRVRRFVDSSPSKGCAAFVYSVLDHRMAGQVIVEAESTPRAVIIAANNTAYLFTEPDPTDKVLGPFLMDYLQSGVSDEGVTLWATSPAQVTVLQTLFSLEARRIVLSFSETAAPGGPLGNNLLNNLGKKEQNDGYRLETFVEKAGGQSEAKNAEASDLAEATCFGARMIYADTIVSACYSDLFAGGEAEVQIRTHPDHRRKGLAFTVAQRFIAQARAYNLRPAWSCDEDNAASYNLATRLGFINGTRLYGYYLHPAFLTWRQDTRKIGPSPEAKTTGFEEEAAVQAADTVLRYLLEADETNTGQGHPIQLLVLPRPDGIEAQLVEEGSYRAIQTFPLAMRVALTAQLKLRAGMHIDRQGFPQRGRFAVAQGTTERVVRLLVCPSEYGEKMLLSLL